MTTNELSTEEISSICIDIDGEKHCLKLSHSNTIAELRIILENDDEITSDIRFLNTEGCFIRPKDEESITINELLNKDNIIQLKTYKNKQTSIKTPVKEYNPIEKELNSKYVTTLSQSTRTSLPEIKQHGSAPIRSQNKINLPTELDSQTWNKIFVLSNLFYGIRMDDKTPKSADHPFFKFRESDNLIPRFKVEDHSNIKVHMKDNETQSSFVSSRFFDGGLEVSCPYIGIGVNTQYLKSKSTTNTERTVYITCCSNYPRVKIILHLSYLQPTLEFIEEIDNVISIVSPNEQIIKLEELYKTYGHVYPRTVVLGGHLYHTERHAIKDKAEEEKKRISAETSFKASILKLASIHIGGRQENNSQKKSSEQTSEMTYKAVGGNTLNTRDTTIWAESVNDPLLWRVIEQDDYQPIITLLDKERQNKIQEIENSNAKKKKFGHMSNSKWKQHGITIAGGNKQGNQLNQLCNPEGIFIDDHQNIYIADYCNDHIVEWKCNAKNGQILAGGNGRGKKTNQLNYPRDVLIDKENNSLIIADSGNRRVIRWSRLNNTTNGQIIIEDIDCYGITMDKDGSLYVSDCIKNEVKRWKRGETNGTIVAGGNGRGDHLNQLDYPTFIFGDEDYSLYVSDSSNHRVMKWLKDAQEGIIVAGGNGEGNSLTQLNRPEGVIVDQLGQIYVADLNNHRLMRWCRGDKKGSIVVGGNGKGEESNQLKYPRGLSFDLEGNVYVVDEWNHRIQKFEIE